jgi:hypothetical protein
MNCWHCKTELIWGGDDDCDEEMEFALATEYSMVTNLSCPTCRSFVLVYYPQEDTDDA